MLLSVPWKSGYFCGMLTNLFYLQKKQKNWDRRDLTTTLDTLDLLKMHSCGAAL